MVKFNIDEEIPKIRKAFERAKINIDQIGNGLLDNKKDTISIERKLVSIKKEVEDINKRLEKIETNSNTGLILDKLKVLTENQKIQEKEITKLKSNSNGNIIKTTKLPNNKLIGNKRTKKVHYSNCQYVGRLKPGKYVEFENVKDALKSGYNRCQCIFNN